MNDLSKKNNKHLLILGQTELYIKYLESIIYYALDACKLDYDVTFFTIESVEKTYIYLNKYKFSKNKLIIDKRGQRKISKVSNLCNYLVGSLFNQDLVICVPNKYEELQYYTTRDKTKP